MSQNLNLMKIVRTAALDKGITGVVAMSEHCGLTYRKVRKVWEGDSSAKLIHVEVVLKSLGKKLAIVNEED